MVANFAMNVLNGIGGAKLENIFTGIIDNKSSNIELNKNINLGNNYKYVILEIYNVLYYIDNRVNEALDQTASPTQTFIATNNNYSGVRVKINPAVMSSNYNTLNKIKINGNNLNVILSAIAYQSSEYTEYYYNIYCFN